VLQVLKNKKGEFGLMTLLSLLFGSILIGASVLNSTDNSSFNSTLSNYTGTVSYSVIINNQSSASNNIGTLAKVFNEDNLDFDREFKNEYLSQHNDFSYLNFKSVVNDEDDIFTIGAKNANIQGFNVGNKNFAIHLILCNSYERYCSFRINGIPTKKLFSFEEFGNTKKNSFDLDENHTMRINSIDFNFCDNKRFCDFGTESYNILNLTITRKP